MNPDPSKLRQEQQQAEQTSGVQFGQESRAAQQFNSVEELIRFDADQNKPPEALAERVKESITLEPKPVRSWWQRLFRGSS